MFDVGSSLVATSVAMSYVLHFQKINKLLLLIGLGVTDFLY